MKNLWRNCIKVVQENKLSEKGREREAYRKRKKEKKKNEVYFLSGKEYQRCKICNYLGAKKIEFS